MGTSIHAAMYDLVAADAARMSGRKFADARGAGLARRVRTRRTVRAAGVGGVSTVAVGTLAFGATHIPWGTRAELGAVSTECATPWPSPSPSEEASPFTVLKGTSDQPENTWIVSDVASGKVLFTMSPEEAGKTWKVTYPSGVNEVVQYSLPGEVALDVPGTGAVRVSVAMNDGATEIAVNSPALPQAESSPRASDDCYTASPTPSSVPSATPSSDPNPSPEPGRPVIATVVTKPEEVVVGTNPFQCGFAFPTDSSAADGLWTLVAEQNSVADVNARLADYSDEPPQALGTDPVFTVTMVDHFAATLGSMSTIDQQAIDPALVANRAQASGVSLVQDATFVAVVNGAVVGTVDPDSQQTPLPLLQESLGTVFDNTITLLNPDSAFTACPGIALGNDWTPYVVVGDAALDAAGATYGPVYGWLKLGGN